uniref:Uncharacterized protein n=1 Tax=Nelumbo nucifera TaxID=4432 RepID=A0A822XD69_NELNU|nr:TPA_asm: hypothetical protein HUJ06_019723 [Nelumbo nucifera]
MVNSIGPVLSIMLKKLKSIFQYFLLCRCLKCISYIHVLHSLSRSLSLREMMR